SSFLTACPSIPSLLTMLRSPRTRRVRSRIADEDAAVVGAAEDVAVVTAEAAVVDFGRLNPLLARRDHILTNRKMRLETIEQPPPQVLDHLLPQLKDSHQKSYLSLTAPSTAKLMRQSQPRSCAHDRIKSCCNGS